MNLQIYLFASLAETLGKANITIMIEKDEISVEQLKKQLIEQFPAAATMIAISFIARNQVYARPEDMIYENDEIALIPPVSGGQGGEEFAVEMPAATIDLYTISSLPISVEEVTLKVIDSQHGATLAFVGTTREFTQGKRTVLLVYEAYLPMALATMKQIGDEIDAKWPGTHCAISHRLGKVEIGETSVVIAISTPHRADCYEASRYAIERLKQIVPIWKKEVWEDGSEWKGPQQGNWNPILSNEENQSWADLEGEHA